MLEGAEQVNGLPYYKAYPRDFIEGTIGMPFELKAAYRLVLDLIYMQGGNLPDDARYISGLLGCSIRKWKSLRADLIAADKLQVSGEFLSNYRAEKELETLAKLQEVQREKASRPRKNKDLRQPQQSQPEPEPEPIKNNVHFAQFWNVWPHKKSKAQAEKAWAKIPASERREVIDRTPAWCRQWREENPQASHILPASYLNGRRWEDEASTPNHNGKVDHGWFGMGRDYSHA